MRHGWWTRRLTAMRRSDVFVTARSRRYPVERVRLADRSIHEIPVEREKGVDLRPGLDVVGRARNGESGEAILFSRDQDLAEVAREVGGISRVIGQWLKLVSAFPDRPKAASSRGIDHTVWFRRDREFHHACLDPRARRPRRWTA